MGAACAHGIDPAQTSIARALPGGDRAARKPGRDGFRARAVRAKLGARTLGKARPAAPGAGGPAPMPEQEETPVQFTVGFKLQEKMDHVTVDGEDALIAALKVKAQRPQALITYVRPQNRRGDTRHPAQGLGHERH